MPDHLRRDFDVIIFGATGYTGDHVARYLSLAASNGEWPNLRWAMAGRNKAKLEALASRWSLEPTGIVVADVVEPGSLRDMAARCSVVMNATGPYRFYGENVVVACIAAKADYVDLCGEPEFIDRCLLKHADAAKAAGVLIVHSCAFDSVPADIGCLFTALQFPPPALCAHADMYHTFGVGEGAKGAAGHATTFYAAVHGFGGADATRKQRKQLLAKLEAERPGSSAGATPLGPMLRVAPGPAYKKALRAYTFLFPGSDVAVVRTSQRTLANLKRDQPAPAAPAASAAKPREPHLTPQFGASFCVKSTFWAAATTTCGLLFTTLSKREWGRRLLLKHPDFFTLGMFSDAGPTEEYLSKASFKAIFFGRGWSEADPAAPPSSHFDTVVRTSVSGPEPGYIATARMFSVMARHVLEDRPLLGVSGGVYTPGGLCGSGGAPAINKLVGRLGSVGVKFAAEERRTLPPKDGDEASRRPAWQQVLNLLALSGWGVALAMILSQWPSVSASLGSPLMTLILASESICVFEVVQIALGLARGNVVLGCTLHYTRLIEALVILPLIPHHLVTRLVLLAWSLTELFRYPMFLAPGSKLARLLRYVTPVLTFPLGCGGEAWAAQIVHSSPALAGRLALLRFLVWMVVPVNVLGGTFYAYPGLVKKALKALKGKAA